MVDVRELPASIVPDGWAQVDTSIDAEPPEVPETLSPDQFRRHLAAIAALLRTAGLSVRTHTVTDGTAELHVTNPALGYEHFLELTVRTDRSAEWVLEAGGETPEPSPTTTVAAHVLAVLTPTAHGQLKDRPST